MAKTKSKKKRKQQRVASTRRAETAPIRVERVAPGLPPSAYQERHSPTFRADVTVWDSDEGTATARTVTPRRRRADEWLGNLDAREQQAAAAIRSAFLIRTSGMGLRAGQLIRIEGGPRRHEAGDEALCRAYVTCCRRAKAEKAIGSRGLAMAVGVLGMGESLRETARIYHCHVSVVRRQVGLVLALYCQVRGWRVRQVEKSA